MGWLGEGWAKRKVHSVTPGAGAGTNYQIRLHLYWGSGVDSGEDVYLGGFSQANFGDLRFTRADGTTEHDYWIQSKTDGVEAVVWVEIADSLETNAQSLYVYYANPSVVSTSNITNTFVDVIPGVVGAWAMDELSGQTVTDYSGNANHGTATGTTIVHSPFYVGKKARNFDGSSDEVLIASIAPLQFTRKGSLFVMLQKSQAMNDNDRVIERGAASSFNFEFEATNQNVRFWDAGYGVVYNGVTAIGVPCSVGVSIDKDAASQNIKTYFNGTYANSANTTSDLADATSNWRIGRYRYSTIHGFHGILGNVLVFSAVLTNTQHTNLASGYPDASLLAGSVLVRKWATTTQPSHADWGSEESRVTFPQSPTRRGKTKSKMNPHLRSLLLIAEEYLEFKQQQRRNINA
jgi:hypothetical protein